MEQQEQEHRQELDRRNRFIMAVRHECQTLDFVSGEQQLRPFIIKGAAELSSHSRAYLDPFRDVDGRGRPFLSDAKIEEDVRAHMGTVSEEQNLDRKINEIKAFGTYIVDTVYSEGTEAGQALFHESLVRKFVNAVGDVEANCLPSACDQRPTLIEKVERWKRILHGSVVTARYWRTQEYNPNPNKAETVDLIEKWHMIENTRVVFDDLPKLPLPAQVEHAQASVGHFPRQLRPAISQRTRSRYNI